MKTRKIKKWEKIFVISSIAAIVIISGFYAFRLFKYYKEEHAVSFETVQKLKDVLTKDNNIIYSGEGLVKENDNLYTYKGKKVNNYLSYAGINWRIINVSEGGIRLVSDEAMYSLKNNRDDIDYVLDSTINKFSNYENYLVKTDYFVDSFKLDNPVSEKTNNSYYGLLSFNEYVSALGKDSYLNNGSYFYLGSSDMDSNLYYVYSEGGVKSSDDMSFNGVRMVITLSNEVLYESGNGTIESPYMVKVPENLILESKGIGSYVKIADELYRIVGFSNASVKLILDNPLEEKMGYYDALDAIDAYINNLDKNTFVKCDFYNGEYSSNYKGVIASKYNYYASLPSVLDSFVTSYEDSWVLNETGIDVAKFLSKDDGRLYIENEDEKHYIRPVVCVNGNISITGLGTKTDPFIIGGSR